MVKALVEGFGGITTSKSIVDADTPIDMPPAAFFNMQQAAVAAIAARAGNRLPVMQGRDPDLPKVAPIFDLDEMRRKNAEVSVRRAARKTQGDV